jgi:hypothetical protein
VQDSENSCYELGDIFRFLREQAGLDEIDAGADLSEDLGFAGEGFTKLIRAFSLRFGVDISGYLWYFHTREEGATIGTMLFKPPHERVEHMPVTPELLLDVANKGFWDIDYPEHEIPSSRADILINILVVFAIIFLLLWVARDHI